MAKIIDLKTKKVLVDLPSPDKTPPRGRAYRVDGYSLIPNKIWIIATQDIEVYYIKELIKKSKKKANKSKKSNFLKVFVPKKGA